MIQSLRNDYPNKLAADIAEQLGIRLSCVYGMAGKLGLKKSAEFLTSTAAGRIQRGNLAGAEFRFKKGQQSWNKGKKGTNYGGKSTQFKPGELNGRAIELRQPIGAERISGSGYIERKINNDMPYHRRWRAVHLINWEQVNGPLPAGHVVTFKDGNKLNVEYDNLILVTKQEIMQRNSFHQYGPEIASLVLMRSAITRQIIKKEKNEQ